MAASKPFYKIVELDPHLIPGAVLKSTNYEKHSVTELKRYLECRGVNNKGKELDLITSRAIAKYLVQKFATMENRHLYPVDITQQARVDRLLYFDQGSLAQNITNYFKPQAVFSDIPNPILGGELEHSLNLLENIVSKNRYALGGIDGDDHLTIADFSFLASLSALESMDYSYERYENICMYVDSLKDELLRDTEGCLEGVVLMKDWARKNFEYLPNYET